MTACDTDNLTVQLNILKKFPTLVPIKTDFSAYQGFIKVKNALFQLEIEAPYYPQAKDVILNCDWELTELLKDHRITLSKWSDSGMRIDTFLEKLYDFLLESFEKGDFSRLGLDGDTVTFEGHINNLQIYSSILKELQEIGNDNILSISSDLEKISLNSSNCKGEIYSLNLSLSLKNLHDNSGKNYFDVVDTDLPEPIIKLIQKQPNIVKAFATFCHQIEVLSRVWTSLEHIDELCWVIDPTHPRKADMYRRIFISPPSVMAHLTWDPLHPNQPPDLKFQGADAEVDGLRCTYEEHLEDWNLEGNIVENLCTVLQLPSLPSAPPPDTNDVSQTVETGECSICYNIQLEGKLPEQSCGKCLTSFHTSCLYEWLAMMPGSRQVHGHISGPCPNCETATKCPCPQH